VKRLTDIVLSLTALALLSPVLLLAALAVVFDSGLPVFFKQTRIGLGGREFGMFKFRSMVKNAASTGPYFTDTNDVRVTRVGQFIRRTSIDELPQIINVLLGDMSLVGPRPDVPVQQSLYAPEDWSRRCSVRPGITGLAQVMIRSLGSHQDRLDLDLAYIRDQNFWLDVKVMWLTLGRLSGKGGN
jgi:lipopolysaccharide/colanic/teichoic acid biosynthesis glycosyltransferase